MGALISHDFSHSDNTLLPDLWRRRNQLSGDEMVSMCELVRSALRAYHPLELHALAEDKEELVAQFIYAKVLRLEPGHAESHACPDSAPSSRYAICAYFRRYLIDCLRSASHQRNVSMEVEGIEQEIDAHAHALEDPVDGVLKQYGLDEARVREAARRFIAGLDAPEQVVLAGSLGWGSETKGGLSRIAAQHRVPSYHYRAVKLGVTMKKTAQADDFSNTKIGRWLVDALGIDIHIENREAILVALNLLAVEASRCLCNEAAA
ncbi:hypothetical protein FAZ69_01675 [Trinickia terrae]|uniref:Uncharacterized protein n=1 Tax=Trinickia terrae TaxID=2571161 RepID=A0A4U1IFB4_9BURK|nr:hypothetical protein [Trinickia terrae]TKC92413.1 hypothetical protein FAZ69_01675 [Trinickia terrae]